MTDDRRAQIKNILDEVISKYQLEKNLPVNLSMVCKSENIILQETENYQDGKLEYDEFIKSYKIMYVKNEYNWRHNFTIAHELGHYYLKHLDMIEGNSIYRDDKFNNINPEFEEEANYFAAGFLVPQLDFEQRYTKLYETKMSFSEICKELSSFYEVSTQVIENRFNSRRLY